MVMRTCFLHIGLPKTGTTSIQHSFLHFDDGKTAFAVSEKANHSPMLIALFASDPLNKGRYPPFQGLSTKAFKAQQGRYRKQFEVACQMRRNVVFSAESLPVLLTAEDVKRLGDHLRERFDAVKVIAYVRPYLAGVASTFQQQVKFGRGVFGVPSVQYRRYLEPFLSAFGRDDMLIVPFARERLIGGDAVDDFAQRIGVRIEGLPRVTVNESLSLEATAALFARNKQGQGDGSGQLALMLEGFGAEKFGFEEALLEQAAERYRTEIDWLSALVDYPMLGKAPVFQRPVSSGEALLELAEQLDLDGWLNKHGRQMQRRRSALLHLGKAASILHDALPAPLRPLLKRGLVAARRNLKL